MVVLSLTAPYQAEGFRSPWVFFRIRRGAFLQLSTPWIPPQLRFFSLAESPKRAIRHT